MSTVTPVPPRVPPSVLAGNLNATAVAINAAQALQSLQAGQSLQATLSTLLAANQVQVATALGQLTLQTTLPLPPGAVLTLVLTSQSPQPTFQITAINGKAVQGSAAQAASAQGTQATLQPSTALPTLSTGASITVTLLRPADGVGTPPTPTTQPGQAPASASPPSAKPGTTTQPTTAVGAPPVTTKMPDGSQAPQAPQIQGASRPGAAQPSTTPGAPQQPGALAAEPKPTTLPAGTRFGATVERIETPSAAVSTPNTAASAKALATGQIISGTVAGRTANGMPIVQTPNATFALGAQSTLGEGAKISFRLDTAPLPPTLKADATLAMPTPGGMHDLISTKSWSNFDEALKALAGADPGRLAQVAQNALPQPGPKLSNQLLFFLSALKGGDLKGLFGDSAMRVIDKERPGLLARLGSDFQVMSRLADEPQQGDWRLALIPMWNGEKVEQLRFFWRGGNPEEADESEEETRFVLDLELSQMGHLQIDGLVKAKRRHTDLIIRTDQPLPNDIRADIADIFETARETLGLGGQLAFQAAPGNFITVPNAAAIAPTAALNSGLLA